MKLSRPFLHTARIAVAVLFWPVLAFVIWGEVLAPEGVPVIQDINDKVLHLNAYFILAAMAAATVKQRRTAVAAGLGLILLGGMLEIVQGAVGRDMSIYDEYANTGGVILGGTLARIVIEPLLRRFDAW
jgi:VanZ family protein